MGSICAFRLRKVEAMTTPADPAAIDLESLAEKHATAGLLPSEIDKLFAGVEALQARIRVEGLPCICRFRSGDGAIRHGFETGVLVDPDEPIEECDLHKALRERVAGWEARAKAATMLAIVDPASDTPIKWKDRAEAAEARVVGLAAQAMEQARGFEQLARDAVSDLRRYARDVGSERRMVSVQLYEKALAKLDALGKEAE